MLRGCRPAGRLFYLVLAVVTVLGALMIGREASAGEPPSPKARPGAAEPAARAASPTPQSGPALTSVIDTVYMADGTPAQGMLLISWPAFVSASGTAVAAGNLDVTLGTNGALNVALTSNAGAAPAGVYYTVVYQLQPSEVRTEYWVVPTSSPATLAQVRTTPGAGIAAQPVSMQYVNSQLATKANDNAVVHLAGTETITGTKSFATPPNVPAPVNTGDVANKSYVDNSIAAVGAGNYLPTAGGAMTGPLTLAANPTAPLQAAPKQYVDSGLAVKADLISGTVPTSELGTGAASSLNCLLGSGSWGPCGSSANATAIQSVPVASTTPGDGQVLTYSASAGEYAPATPSGATGSVTVTPSASQSIAQPLGTQFSVNNQSGARYVTVADNWSVSPAGSLTAGTQATVTLAPCPVGVDTTGYSMYYVYLSVQGTPEPAMVTGGTCAPGAASGTIIFTPKNSHAAGYKISSASSGIQEAINDACGLPSGVNAAANPNAKVILPATGALANAIPVYGTVYAHCSRALIEGNGTLLSCSTRDRCMVLGDLVNSNHYGGVTLRGVNFTSTVRQDGCQITSTQRQSNVVTIVTASACSTIQTGDIVNINFTDNPSYWGNHGPVTVSGTSITYNQTGGNIAAAATPGTIAIENAAVEDNSMPGTMEDIKSSSGGGGNFNQFFVMDDDEQATIRNFDADGTEGLLCTVNHCGSYVYSWGGSSGAPVISISNANISPQCGGNGVTVYGNNTVRVTDSVIQGFGMWAVNTQNLLGNYGGTSLENVYMEEGGGPCPHPYEGNYFSATGIIFEGSLWPLLVRGGEQPGGHVPAFGAQNPGNVQYNYYVIANDTTSGWHSAPFFAGYALTNGTGSVSGQFPHIPAGNPGDTVTYDILRMQPATSLAANTPSFPVKGACTGGSATACGSVITAQAQCSGLVCTFTDPSTSANTSSYTINGISWTPVMPFWPAAVLLAGGGGQGYITPGAAFDTEPSDVVAVNWNAFPEVFVRYCTGISDIGSLYGGAWEECQEGTPNSTTSAGTLLSDGTSGTGTPTGVKGRLNFESIASAAHHIITLVDSNLAKTTATINFRPPNDANDTYIGLDNAATVGASGAQLAFGAPVSISNYIGNKGDNTSFLERLTAAVKTFNVPVTVNGNLTVTGTCTGCGGGGGSGTVNSGTATQVALYAANGSAVSGDSGLTDNGSTLTYAGANGISASAGAFSGNVTVNGQLLVAGPWTVSSPIPGTAMAAAGAGTSALGISNDGNFYISTNGGSPQEVATSTTSSFFSNLFQEDANDIGEYNGTTAQNLHVYSSYTNSSTWQRTSLGFDTADNYAVVRSESSPSGTAPGLGFWVNSGLKWVIDGTNNFKPWTDQTYNIGSFNSSGSGSGLRPATIYVAGNSTSGSGLELGRFANESYELCNDTSTGTIINGLATLSSAGCAIKPSSTLTSGAIGVVITNAGTSGVATLAKAGSAYCSFDGTATVIGDYVVPSSTSGLSYLCHDAGATRPVGTQILGRVLQASAGSTTVQMFLDMPGSSVSSGTPPGTGNCTNQAVTAVNAGAAPTCATVTSAYVDNSIAPTASPALTGTPTAPTPATSDSSTKIATTAWVNAQGYGTGSGNVTGPGSSTNGDVATFSGTNGKTIQDSGTAVSSLAPLASPALTGTPTAPTASAGDNSTKIATTAYVKNEVQLAWTCPVAGSTSVSQNCNWTIPAGLTITGFDFAANTAPAGCSPYATVQLWDGTANAEVGSYSIAMSSGNSFYTQVTGSTNVASGHQLRVKVTTAASGCTTSAGGMVATVTYQMQN